MEIILPNVHPTAEEIAQAKANRQRYEQEPELKALADKIHEHRMMPPPACNQCIAIAIERLAKQ